MKKLSFISTSIVAAAALLAGSPAAKAAVTPLSTFNFDLAGFNYSQTTGYFLTANNTVTFGVPTTFTGAGPDGQDISVTSGETINGTTTTDTFTISTPTNFLTDSTIDGTTISDLELNLGDVNSGGAVSVVLPITSYTATGSIIYGTGSSNTAILTPTTMIGAGGTSYGAAEGVNTGSATPISGYDVHSITYSITYNTLAVPEPSSWMLLCIGGALATLLAARRLRLAR